MARRPPRSTLDLERRAASRFDRGPEPPPERGVERAAGPDPDVEPEPATPGELLRAARLRRRISLADAEQATRIRLQYLKAIEDDDFAGLPAGVYSRGFIRNYAIFLGVPPEDVMGGVRPRRGRERPPSLRSVTRPIRLTAPRAVWLVAVVALVAALGVAFIAWLGLTAPSDATRPNASGVSPAASTTPLVQLPPLAPTASATAAPSQPTAAPTPAGTQVPAGPVDVQVRIVDRSWVRATVDGKVVLEDILATGAVQRWTGQQSVLLRVGNAGGVDVTFNGQRIGVLGPSGQPLDREFTR
jgi:cytoskeletal protein RodZ